MATLWTHYIIVATEYLTCIWIGYGLKGLRLKPRCWCDFSRYMEFYPHIAFMACKMVAAAILENPSGRLHQVTLHHDNARRHTLLTIKSGYPTAPWRFFHIHPLLILPYKIFILSALYPRISGKSPLITKLLFKIGLTISATSKYRISAVISLELKKKLPECWGTFIKNSRECTNYWLVYEFCLRKINNYGFKKKTLRIYASIKYFHFEVKYSVTKSSYIFCNLISTFYVRTTCNKTISYF